MRLIDASAVILLGAFFFGCAVPPHPVRHRDGYSTSAGDRAAETALSMVGRPYKFTGETPAGFDCSGLVRYSYLAAGMNVPHSTGELRRRTHPVSSREIRRGDLVFFTQLGKKYSHVGIYTGNGNFIHAPSSGKTVRIDSLDAPYWRKHFLGARRF